MREDGYITLEQEEEAIKMLNEIVFAGKGGNFKAPHFVQYVQQILEEKYGPTIIEQGGYKIKTTLDLKLQEKAQEIVSEEIDKVEKLHITNGAAVVIDSQTGEILAMVGSKDFNAEDYDGRCYRIFASPVRHLVLLCYSFRNIYASTLLMDVPTEFPGGS
jgi:membrane peptidoglycan carboxypeptidase